MEDKYKSIRQLRVERVKELQKEYSKLAKTANRRMRSLEKLAEREEYKAVLGYAYRDATHDLKAKGELTKSGRFSTDIVRMSAEQTDIRHLVALINIAKTFLEAPSSTKTGIDEVYWQRAETINDQYDTNLTPDDMKTFFETSYWTKLNNILGSQTAMIVIGKIQENSEKILSEAEEAREKHKRIIFSDLGNVKGLNVNNQLSPKDKQIVEKLAEIYTERKH